MQKVFYITTTSVFLCVEAALAQSVVADPTYPYPVVPRANINQLACYMETENGDILQLDTLCGRGSIAPETNRQVSNTSENRYSRLSDMPSSANSQTSRSPSGNVGISPIVPPRVSPPGQETPRF
jgi:hypothetical protein